MSKYIVKKYQHTRFKTMNGNVGYIYTRLIIDTRIMTVDYKITKEVDKRLKRIVKIYSDDNTTKALCVWM